MSNEGNSQTVGIFKNTLTIDLNSSREQNPIMITKPEDSEKPDDGENAYRVLYRDIVTLTETLDYLVSVGDDSNYIENGDAENIKEDIQSIKDKLLEIYNKK